MSDGSNSPPRNRERRSSFTGNTFSSLFARNNSVAGPAAVPVQPNPNPVTAAATTPAGRRMSIAAIGLSGASPIQTSGFGFPGNARRGSISTNGSDDSVNESAIDDDVDGPAARSVPTTPFARRMSFGAQALFNARGSPGSTNGRVPSTSYTQYPARKASISGNGTGKRLSPSSSMHALPESVSQEQVQASTSSHQRMASNSPSSHRPGFPQEGLNWSEQFRSRAESAVKAPTFLSSSPTNSKFPSMSVPKTEAHHERAKSFGDMPTPPQTMPVAPPAAPAAVPARQPSMMKRKPDAVGERILRGDFYMD